MSALGGRRSHCKVETGHEAGNLLLSFLAAGTFAANRCFLTSAITLVSQVAYTATVSTRERKGGSTSVQDLYLLNAAFEANFYGFLVALSAAVGLEAGALGYMERLAWGGAVDSFVGALSQTGVAFSGFCLFYLGAEHGTTVAHLSRLSSDANYSFDTWLCARTSACALGVATTQVVAALQTRHDVPGGTWGAGWALPAARAGLGIFCAVFQLWVNGLVSPARTRLRVGAVWATFGVAVIGLVHTLVVPDLATRHSHAAADALIACAAAGSAIFATTGVSLRRGSRSATDVFVGGDEGRRSARDSALRYRRPVGVTKNM